VNKNRIRQTKNVLINNKLRIAITNQCNLSCSYCHNEGQSLFEPSRFLSLDYIKTMVKWFIAHDVFIERLSITGGEPLLHPDVIKIIHELKKVTEKLLINTNGLLLTKELLDMFLEQNISLKIGVDSIVSEQTKPSVCAIPKSVDRLISVIKYAVSNGNEIIFNAVFSEFNCKNIDVLIEWAIKENVRGVKVIKQNDFDSRRLGNKDNIADKHKTNQIERDLFFDLREKYISRSWSYSNYPYRGKIIVFLRQDDGTDFEISFYDDVCSAGACANTYTTIDSCGNLMVCPKYQITTPVDFRKDFETVTTFIMNAKDRMCDSSKNRFDLKNNNSIIGQMSLKQPLKKQ